MEIIIVICIWHHYMEEGMFPMFTLIPNQFMWVDETLGTQSEMGNGSIIQGLP